MQKSRKICIYQKFVVSLRSKLFLGVISIMNWSGSRSDTRPFFLCFITHFRAKNTKKCKKMQKNAKKLQKNLHISKICCNFAPSFKKEGHETPKSNPKNKQKK